MDTLCDASITIRACLVLHVLHVLALYAVLDVSCNYMHCSDRPYESPASHRDLAIPVHCYIAMKTLLSITTKHTGVFKPLSAWRATISTCDMAWCFCTLVGTSQ